MSHALGLALDATSWVLLTTGASFCVLGGLGIVRFPDFYTRVHAAGLTDTLGAGLILLGLAFQSHELQVTIKLAMVLVFLVISSPTASHALVKAAHGYGVRLEGDIPAQPLAPGESPFLSAASSTGSSAPQRPSSPPDADAPPG